jgi:lipoprotein signal peptidase
MYSKIVKTLFIAALIMANIGCDQVSKIIVREHISYNEYIKFVNNLVTLTKVENTGAFSVSLLMVDAFLKREDTPLSNLP